MNTQQLTNLQKRQKGWALFFTPRCGSTPIARTLCNGLSTLRPLVYLEEILNQDFKGVHFKDGLFQMQFENWSRVKESKSHRLEQALQVQKQRMKWLEESKEIHFFKFNSLRLNAQNLEWIFENYKVIFCERENLFEQLLSFLISWQTNLWYAEEGISIEDISLTATMQDFRLFETLILSYNQIKRAQASPLVFTYESFVSLGEEGFLKTLGLSLPQTNSLSLSPKQNLSQKIKKFKNAEEITDWYRGSFLEALFPLDS